MHALLARTRHRGCRTPGGLHDVGESLRVALLLLALAVWMVVLWPRALSPTRVVGDQARAERLRSLQPRASATAPRVCGPREVVNDRDPCLPLGAEFAPAQ